MILIIFDVDGTLVHSNKVDSRCFASTYETVYGKPFPTIDWRQYPHVTDTTIFNEVIGQHFQRSADRSEMNAFCDAFVENIQARRHSHPHEFGMVPGAREMVNHLLQEEDYVVGIATGGWEKPARIKLAHVGIPDQELYFSGADGKWTREDIIREVLDQAGQQHGSFRKVVYVGDAIWDVTTTRQMSLDFVGIRHRNDREVLEKAGARHVVQNYLNREAFIQAVKKATPPM